MKSTEAAPWPDLDATLVEVGSDRPWLLTGARAWWVRRGRVDVFAVEVENGEVVGSRRHLFRVEEGDLLLGTGTAAGPRGIGLLAVGGGGTQLAEIGRDRLHDLAVRPGHGAAVCLLLEQWVDTVCRSMSRDTRPEECVLLPSGADSAPPALAHARPEDRVGWVRHLEGHSLLLGRSELRVNGVGFTPLSSQAWLEVGQGSRLRVEPTEALLGNGSLWEGLDRLHELLLRCAEHDGDRQAVRDGERLHLKTRVAGAALRNAFTALAETLDPTELTESTLPGDALPDIHHELDPFYASCHRVGRAMDIRVRPLPRSADAAPIRDPLGALGRANRFRTRQVVLREGWWTEDMGPMLGSMVEDGRPVALVRGAGGRYLLSDPQRRGEVPVTEEVAESVAPLAHSFYRPFPDHPLGIADIVRFGLRGCRRDIGMVLAMGAAGGLLSLVTPIATGMVFNDIIPGAARPQLVQLTLILLTIAVASAMFSITSGVALVRIESRMGSSVQAGVWDRLLALPMPFFRPYTAGNLATRALGIDRIRQMLSGATITALIGGMFSVFHFALLFYYSPRLALWASLLLAAAIVVTLAVGRTQTRWERTVVAVQNRLAGYVLQTLSSVSKLRVAAAETQAFAIWARQFGQQRQLQFRASSTGNTLAAFQAGLPLLSTLVLYAVALPLLKDATTGLRTGDFLAFMTSFAICMGGMLAASSALVGASMIIPLYEQARPILSAAPEVDTARTDPGVLSGEIEVQHLSFRYAAERPLVLRDLSLRIHPGEFVAFVGPSGSGKSTLLRLLLGFESTDSGVIYYDGQELAGLDVQAVRQQIGVVLQNGRLMTGDIFTNIVGSSGAPLEEAWEAAAMAGFADDVRKMPMGMHTGISEGSGTLSGGQRQRLMIARAIVRKPRILFFDEATSALDNRTQSIVSASLERLQATRVVIAHRLSTVVNADHIYVVESGRITQHGTYAELIAQEGLFAELARRQLA